MRYHDHMYWGDGGWSVFGVVMMVGFVLLVVLGVILLIRLLRTPAGPGPGDVMYTRPVPPPRGWYPAPGADPAVTELRLRYARGEVSRDEYLRTAADLGAPPEPAAGGGRTPGGPPAT